MQYYVIFCQNRRIVFCVYRHLVSDRRAALQRRIGQMWKRMGILKCYMVGVERIIFRITCNIG